VLGRGGLRLGGWFAPQAKGGAPSRVPPSTLGARAQGRGCAQPTRGWLPAPRSPCGPPGRGGPSRWTPGTLPVAPVQYRYDPETSRCLFDNFPYINLYLRTLPELLVMSRIPSGTPNNIR